MIYSLSDISPSAAEKSIWSRRGLLSPARGGVRLIPLLVIPAATQPAFPGLREAQSPAPIGWELLKAPAHRPRVHPFTFVLHLEFTFS